jgi:phosphomannomutase
VLMIRASGTEPVLRVYCQAESKAKVAEILEKVCAFLQGI